MVDPNISRDLIYIDYMIDLYIKITLNTKIKNGIFNAASGKQYKIIEIYTLINEILGKNINAHWNKMKNRKWDQKIWVADISKAKKILSWKPKNSLKEGLKKTVSWHKVSILIKLCYLFKYLNILFNRYCIIYVKSKS